jgi:hypothetical protein
MSEAIAIGRLTLPEILDTQSLRLADDPHFFEEWQDVQPPLTAEDSHFLDQVQNDYFDQLRQGQLSEGLIKLVIVSPLLHLAGFYRHPYQVRLEEPVQVEITEGNTTWRGRIDALVVQNKLWVVVVESKGGAFGIDQAIPQALGYVVAAPDPQYPVYGLVTNGSSYAFLKLVRQPEALYSVSDVWLLLPGRPILHRVLGVLRAIAQSPDFG